MANGDKMGDEVSDEMLHAVATVSPIEQLADKLKQRYSGIADRLTVGWESDDPEKLEMWQQVIQDLHKQDK